MTRRNGLGLNPRERLTACEVCAGKIPDDRFRQCSRHCTTTAADRRRRGYPVSDADYRVAIKDTEAGRTLDRRFLLQPLPSLSCEWVEWHQPCRCKPTHYAVETWGAHGRRRRGVFCQEHATKFLAKLKAETEAR